MTKVRKGKGYIITVWVVISNDFRNFVLVCFTEVVENITLQFISSKVSLSVMKGGTGGELKAW